MSNYIRACFCVDDRVPSAQFYSLLTVLESLDCRYNFWTNGYVSGYLSSTNEDLSIKELTLDQDSNPSKLQQLADWLTSPGNLNIRLAWHISDKLYEARLVQRWYSQDEPRALSFDIEDTVFLPVE